jgi:hypothetical protein
MSVRLSICPHGTTLLQLRGFSWKLMFGYFSQICRENLSLIKVRQITGTLHEDQYRFLIISRSVLLTNGECFRQTLYRKSKLTFYVQKRVYENRAFRGKVKNYSKARQATDDNMEQTRCLLRT